MDASQEPVVNAAATSFEVLDAVRALDEPGVSDVARHLDRSKSGVYKHLNTLTRLGYLVRTGDAYAVGLATWAAGAGAADRFPIEEGARTVESLAASTGHSVALAFYEGRAAHYVHREVSPEVAGLVGDVGDRPPLHAAAEGKAILAYLPPERLEDALDACSMRAFTEWTYTDRAELRTHLDAVRERRTAVEREERVEGLTGVAAPILGEGDDPIGAIAVLGRTRDLDGEDLEGTTLSLVVNAARSVENAMD